METNQAKKNINSVQKQPVTFLDKLAYPAKYLQLRYNVSIFFIYLVFVFLVLGLLLFIGMVRMI